MESNKLICIEVSNEQLDALEDILTAEVTPEEFFALKGVIMPLWQALVNEYDKGK